MIEGESYWHQQIHNIMPDLEIRSLKLHREGLVNDVLIVNNQWVFRFAKTDWGKEQMATEGELMRFLGSQLPINIPSPEICLDDVIVYPLVKGKEFRREVWQNVDEAGQQAYADQLGGFLRELHGITTNGLGWEVPPTLAPVTQETWEEIYDRVVDSVYPHLLRHQVYWVDTLFRTALDSTGFFDFEPALVHGDLALYHILYSPEENRITGVIDFGVAGLGDPATDLGSLINCYGESLVGKMVNAYPEMKDLLPRARFYAQAIELQWALLGVESGEYYWFTAHIGGARDIRY
jgi:aminoglycoside 2''-phosphotransferase